LHACGAAPTELPYFSKFAQDFHDAADPWMSGMTRGQLPYHSNEMRCKSLLQRSLRDTGEALRRGSLTSRSAAYCVTTASARSQQTCQRSVHDVRPLKQTFLMSLNTAARRTLHVSIFNETHRQSESELICSQNFLHTFARSTIDDTGDEAYAMMPSRKSYPAPRPKLWTGCSICASSRNCRESLLFGLLGSSRIRDCTRNACRYSLDVVMVRPERV